MKRTFGLIVGILLVGILATACSSKPTPTTGTKSSSAAGSKSSSTVPAAPQPTAPPKVEGKLTVYSSASQDVLDAMTAALKAKYPDLDLKFVYGGTEELVDKLNAEFAAGTVNADAIMMADPAYARLLKSQGLLLPYVPAGVDQVKVDRDPEGFYTAVRVLDAVIVYNPDLVKAEEAPKSFKDLIDPKWKGQVTMPDPTKSGTAFATAGALVQQYGWEYFQKAQENGWQVGGSSSAPAKKISDGKVKVGVMVESSFRSAKAKGSKLDMVWPADGVILMESPYAILKGTKNPDAAKALLDWLIAPEAQALFTKGGMHPVISGVQPPNGSLPLDQILGKAMKVDWVKLSQEKGQIQDKFLQVIKVSPN